MGSLIGGVIGGIGQMAAAKEQAKSAKYAADLAMTGYNYLTKGEGAKPMQSYITAGQNALGAQGTTQNAMAQLLGMAPRQSLFGGGNQSPYPGTQVSGPKLGPDGKPMYGTLGRQKDFSGTPGQPGGPLQYDPTTNTGNGYLPDGRQVINGVAQNGQGGQGGGNTAGDAFDQYLNSTGYQFQLGQGMNAINTNAGAKGLLNSGGTAKALQQYGQNLASTTFNNYLTQLSGLNSAQGATAQMGQNALGQIATVGTAAGGGAANATIQGGNASAAGISAGFNTLGNAVGGLFNSIGSNNSSATSGIGGGGWSPRASNAIASGSWGLY